VVDCDRVVAYTPGSSTLILPSPKYCPQTTSISPPLVNHLSPTNQSLINHFSITCPPPLNHLSPTSPPRGVSGLFLLLFLGHIPVPISSTCFSDLWLFLCLIFGDFLYNILMEMFRDRLPQISQILILIFHMCLCCLYGVIY
jgi:hypothetical protein